MGIEIGAKKNIAEIVGSIISQLGLASPNLQKIDQDCNLLFSQTTYPFKENDLSALDPLFELTAKKFGPALKPIYHLLEKLLSKSDSPWPILRTMLVAADRDFVKRALDHVHDLITEGRILFEADILRSISQISEQDDSVLEEKSNLEKIRSMMSLYQLGGGFKSADEIIQHLFLQAKDAAIRRFCAKLLDMEDKPISSTILKRILLGKEAKTLISYIEYTRARHIDLLILQNEERNALPILHSLLLTEKLCGKNLLREVIAAVGWSKVNYGIQVQKLAAISVNGSLPVMLAPAEAALFEKCAQTKRLADYLLFIAQGGEGSAAIQSNEASQIINRFRLYNLLHADLLSEILDIAPLTFRRVQSILGKMEKVVEDFVFLFEKHSKECQILPSLFQGLKEKIYIELEKEKNNRQLSTELTRLVQMFEDPRSLAEVQTLHGLKRYLHQQGLKLGFRFVETGKSPKRTVTIILVSENQIIQKFSKIAFADFEPLQAQTDSMTLLPYAVDLAVQGYCRQMIHGQDSFPFIDIFCYGNEVHYYLSFRNHPAFLRIDYSPPLRGGMIDLEFFGVSNYEVSLHPNITLDYIKYFFRRLEFDVQIEGTHIHARFDKERAIDLASLCEKAAALFRLVPYLMDIDWVIGSLGLSIEAKTKVAEAWAESFLLWGVLPVNRLLSKDRRQVVEKIESGPTGRREIFWPGQGIYQDQFTIIPPRDFFNRFQNELKRLGMEMIPALQSDSRRPMGQIRLENKWLNALREMVQRGEIYETEQGYQRRSNDLFERRHECFTFVEILAKGSKEISKAMVIAKLIRPLEKTLRFQTTGFVEGLEVQRTILSLKDEKLVIFVLRDIAGIIRLAFYAHGSVLYRHRSNLNQEWSSNASLDISILASLLRRENYAVSGPESIMAVEAEEIIQIEEALSRIKPLHRPAPLPGEKIINGLKASPGRAIGRVLFGTEGRSAIDYQGCILVAHSIRPQDNTYIYHAAGVVSTGGGILSHAGLLAIQFNKPALIIDGRWEQQKEGIQGLYYLATHYDEEKHQIGRFNVLMYHNIRDHEYFLQEGDLVVLDTREGMMRVLGQDHDTLAINEGFYQFNEANRMLQSVRADKETLILRGRRLRARHQIERILHRLNDPVLSQHAVREILSIEGSLSYEGKAGDQAFLLRLLLDNSKVRSRVRECIIRTSEALEQRFRNVQEKALKFIPNSTDLWEILELRLDVIKLHRSWKGVIEATKEFGVHTFERIMPMDLSELNRVAVKRIRHLHKRDLASLKLKFEQKRFAELRHLIRQINRKHLLLKTPNSKIAMVDEAANEIEQRDRRIQNELQDRLVIRADEGGFEIFPLIGWKAANLAEVQRLIKANHVPPWFVVTNSAFQLVMSKSFKSSVSGISSKPVREVIAEILSRQDLNDLQKSNKIRKLWNELILPENLISEVSQAYTWMNEITKSSRSAFEEVPFVAMRSSSREEDAESAARAGEFETFLFIGGQNQVLEFLKLTWAGLWTERAIHNRKIFGAASDETGGGILVQKIVWSRVAGVLQTVNVAKGELREMVINVGLGMGEGIVSGLVGADQITVSKEGDLEHDPLKFSYITNDKKQQIIFDKRSGTGTMLSETLYHQRFRAALEYIEIQQLVILASRLEAAYGYPLDIEFAMEGTKLWILQVRPVATFLSTYQATQQRYPLLQSNSKVKNNLNKQINRCS